MCVQVQVQVQVHVQVQVGNNLTRGFAGSSKKCGRGDKTLLAHDRHRDFPVPRTIVEVAQHDLLPFSDPQCPAGKRK